MIVLAIAAETLEIDPWLKHCEQVEPLDWPVAHARRARWRGHELYALANGAGPRLSQAALQTAVTQVQNRGQLVETLMSIGLCGALDPSLPLSALCAAGTVGNGTSAWPACPVDGLPPAKLLSIDTFLGTPSQKRPWSAQGFQIVDMEAAPLAAWAAAHRMPFRAVKVVSDLAEETFALDFNDYRDAAGRFNRASIAWAAATHPFSYAPSLIRMATRGAAASKKLGAFLADFQL